MTGSTLDLILISVIVVIVLAVWIVLVFYADANPAWRRRDASAGHGRAGGSPAGCTAEVQPDAEPGKTQPSPPPGLDTGVPAERAAGTAAGKTRAA
jgi:hypothetical protein